MTGEPGRPYRKDHDKESIRTSYEAVIPFGGIGVRIVCQWLFSHRYQADEYREPIVRLANL